MTTSEIEWVQPETPNSVKVVIDTPGPTITVEATGTLADVAAKALELFTAAGGWPTQGNTVGFGTVASHIERYVEL